jgi:hypothetical protein
MSGGEARGRVVKARRRLRSAAFVAAALRALAGAMLILLMAAAVDTLVGMPMSARRWVALVAIVAAGALLERRVRRSGVLETGITSTALWIESRFPALRYALVTTLDDAYAGKIPELERQVAAVPIEAEVSRAAVRALKKPAIAVVVFGALLFALPAGAVARIASPRPGDVLARLTGRGASNPLRAVVVRVAPPAYSGVKAEVFDDPASVRALVGSSIRIEGRWAMGDERRAAGGGSAIHAVEGGRDIPASVQGERWSVTLAMPAAATSVRLSSGANARLVGLEPVVDSAPRVEISLPVRDSIYRRPSGVVRLAAELSDDYGLASGAFEFIVSSGSGETFTFRSGWLGAQSFTGRTGALATTFSLDSLELKPGDILHVRAVASDRNDVTGPGRGASETRTLRIARTDEYDSVAVDPAPPPEPEKDALSQRMLLLMAEALQKKRPALARADFVRESRSIAVDQTRLRKRVGQIVFTRLGEGEGEEGDALEKRLASPVNADSLLAAADRATSLGTGTALEGNEDETPLMATNKNLLIAYNHMWSASTELEIGEPGKAIPWMKKALDALEAARAAERIYLRGKSRAVVVDVERVRLAGKDKGTANVRAPREPADPARDARLARFDRAVAIARTAASAAADSLLLLRIELLDRDAPAAQAVGAAADALRKAGDATDALVKARRALVGAGARRTGLSAWGTPW